MAMVDLDIEMDDDLIANTHEQALGYFGDDRDVSLAQVLEVAFWMRCLWLHSVEEGQLETDDAISKWQFGESPVTQENSGTIRRWLFRR